MSIDLDELEALAIAASSVAPGDWSAGSGSDPGFIGLWDSAVPGEGALLGVIGGTHQGVVDHERLARFIAATRPDVVLAMIRELRAARRAAAKGDPE